MKNICVKLIQRENKKYRKMLSSEETIFPEFDPESASTSPYTPGATLQDDDWFCITNAKGQEYSIDLLSDTVSTADLDSLTRAEFNKIDYSSSSSRLYSAQPKADSSCPNAAAPFSWDSFIY